MITLTLLIAYNQQLVGFMIKDTQALRSDIQFSYLQDEVRKFIVENLKESKTPKELHTILGYFPLFLSAEKEDIGVQIDCKCASNKININAIAETNGTIHKNYFDLFVAIFDKNNISDPEFLANMVVDAIDSDYVENDYESEISLKNPLFRQGKIVDEGAFSEILYAYAKTKNDEDALKVDWNTYFSYGISDTLDFNCMDQKLIDTIFSDTMITKESDVIYENADELSLRSDEDKEILSRFNIHFYDSKLLCNVAVSKDKTISTYSYLIDLSKNKAAFFEKN